MKHQGLEWAQQIQAIAQNGLAYSQNEFDIERYHQLRAIAAQMMVTGFNFEASVVSLFN
jgi:Hydrolase of X-linked nucleoside diphosphate N terminal